MFSDKKPDYTITNLHTTKYIGTQVVAETFLDLLLRFGGIYVPETWGTDENAQRVFKEGARQEIVREWTLPTKKRYLFFHRKRPVEIQMFLGIDRFPRAKFNRFSMYIRDKYFSSQKQIDEFLGLATELCSIMRVDYGFIAHALQERRHSPALTPAERLPGVYWANFFGRPYIDFFGREKLLGTPCFKVHQIQSDLILLLTAERPHCAAMLENDNIVDQVKRFLNQNAFAGLNFPDEPCNVPQFDFSEVRGETNASEMGSVEERIKRVRADLEAKGYRVISESATALLLQGDACVAIFDLKTGELSLGMSGSVPPFGPPGT